MSDTFDHEGDAWDSYDRAMDEGYGYCWGRTKHSRAAPRGPVDHLYYHSKINFIEIVAESEKCWLIRMAGFVDKTYREFKVWLPKKICRQMDKDKHEVMVHTKTFNKLDRILL